MKLLNSRLGVVLAAATIVTLGGGVGATAATVINGDSIADNTLDGGEIQNSSVMSKDLDANAVTDADIAPGAISSDELDDAAVTADALDDEVKQAINGTLFTTVTDRDIATGDPIEVGSIGAIVTLDAFVKSGTDGDVRVFLTRDTPDPTDDILAMVCHAEPQCNASRLLAGSLRVVVTGDLDIQLNAVTANG